MSEAKKHKNNVTGRLPNIAFVAIIVIQLIYSVFLSQNLAVTNDEIFSMGLANNTGDYLFFTDQEIEKFANENGWFSGDYFHAYLSVQNEDRFHYANVYEKQSHDVHPPLFYWLNHTIYSFFPDNASPVLGRMINVAALVGVSLFLYMSMRKLFGNGWNNLVPVLLFLSSAAFTSFAMYLRMYALLGFFISWMLYIHICLMTEGKVCRKAGIQLAACVMLGGLTHYYFYVCTFFVAATYVCIQFVTDREHKCWNRIRNLIPYAVSVIAGGGMALLIFPYAIKHVLHSSVGSEVKHNLKSSSQQLGDSVQLFLQQVCNGRVNLWIILVLLLLAGSVCFYALAKKKQSVETTGEGKKHKIQRMLKNSFFQVNVTLFVTGICYFFLVARITIHPAWYYICPTFIITVLCISILLLGIYPAERRWIPTIGLFLLVLIQGILYLPGNVQGIKASQQERIAYEDMLAEINVSDVIYISESWGCLYGNRLPDMAEMDEVRCIRIDELGTADMMKVLNGRESTGEQVVFMIRCDEEDMYTDIVSLIESHTERTLQQLWDARKNKIYLLQ